MMATKVQKAKVVGALMIRDLFDSFMKNRNNGSSNEVELLL